MPRQASGSVRWRNGKPYARVTLAKDNRPGILLSTCSTQEQAEERAAVIAELAGKLRASDRLDVAVEFLSRAGACAADQLEAVCRAVDAVCRGQVVPLVPAELVTFREIGEQWTSGELARRYPDHVRPKDPEGDIYRLGRWIYPVVGDVPIARFEHADGKRVMAGLPLPDQRGGSQANRRHVAQIVHRVLQMCVMPLELIKANPLPDGWLPRIDHEKAGSFLYPDEDMRLLACTEIELPYRVLYGFLAREGMRSKSEAFPLQWHDFDLQRGGIVLDENKTHDPRSWALSPGTTAAMLMWKELLGEDVRETDRVFVNEFLHPLSDDHLAERFRLDLKRAGITRHELFESTRSRRRIWLHDLRATFITLSLAAGRTETWVADRTGHSSSEQINGYRRQARKVAELGLGELQPLVQAIPELWARWSSGGGGGLANGPGKGPETQAKLAELADALDSGSNSLASRCRETRRNTPDPDALCDGLLHLGHRGPDSGPVQDHRQALLLRLSDDLRAAIASGDLAVAQVCHDAIGRLLKPSSAGAPVFGPPGGKVLKFEQPRSTNPRRRLAG